MPVKSSMNRRRAFARWLRSITRSRSVVDILREAQEIHGYLTTAVMEEVADLLAIPVSRVYGATLHLAGHGTQREQYQALREPALSYPGAVNILRP